jgi:hypothetical protein
VNDRRPLDERVAAALGVPADANDREVANAVARAIRRRLARRPETVKAYVAAAHAAGESVRRWQNRRPSSANVTVDIDYYLDDALSLEELTVAGEELDLGEDLGWFLGAGMYHVLRDAAVL